MTDRLTDCQKNRLSGEENNKHMTEDVARRKAKRKTRGEREQSVGEGKKRTVRW